ncbi:hypothetical protein FBU30_001501 [Linnemannia zychae]|nr:hypothetical protein FBU30_001501 [Linnemannia zychae]
MQFKKAGLTLMLLLTLSRSILAANFIEIYMMINLTAKQLADAQTKTTICAWNAMVEQKSTDHCGISLSEACGIIKPYIFAIGDEIPVIEHLFTVLGYLDLARNILVEVGIVNATCEYKFEYLS